ncbi:DgyrCDS255 [Dimorphilus gyrociliatus]|uniref:DgyrCDS255 n=1 Tax=Dimorphilus gyrociliatus TaxID=2664684 RepID=A0A7I8V406_9ANNE|nr:DgyrCDS255 [Dimorphilus gyrociliatus]
MFRKFGEIEFIDVHDGGERGPAFAFICFEDPQDAEDAIHARDGYDYKGYKLRVEFPRTPRDYVPRRDPTIDPNRDRSRSGSRSPKSRRWCTGAGPPMRRPDQRVIVSDLPPGTTWYDLKDHMQEAGEVCFATVYEDGNAGFVEYFRLEDMKEAVRKMDDTRFMSREGTISYIRVREDEKWKKDDEHKDD